MKRLGVKLKLNNYAKTQMSSIPRNFKSRSLNHMLCLWKSILIPRLDYFSQLWNPIKRVGTCKN